MNRFFTRIIVFSILSMGLTLYANTISGLVKDIHGNPIPNVDIVVVDSQHDAITVTTNALGRYTAQSLSPDTYIVSIKVPAGYELVTPPCGFHQADLFHQAIFNADFLLKNPTTGVVVEFGRPGGALVGSMEGLPITADSFGVSLFVRNLNDVAPHYPTTILIKGFWHTPGSGPIAVETFSWQAAGAYIGSDINVELLHLAGDRVMIRVELFAWPFFSYDGEMVQLQIGLNGGLHMIKSNSDLVGFCFEDIQLSKKGTVLAKPHSHFLEKVQ